ncbi:hypothetical protein SAMN05216298_1067 [Glycomyces sambucus]|uniref:Uncharacterized protein n=1 Tax=Glycomyces sambucus TaxID=380244 RepID=A0A1G9DSR2_9ACTN|nr:hypothetical protein [Glycomyces sambucus]SDK66840.1 hypothetical protein SAMN05216298_1067 [Glycomyces sambucus]
MSKGLRVLLQLLQVVGLLGTLLLLAASVAWHLADLDFTGFAEDAPLEQWAVGFGVLTVALSPALWSLARSGGAAPAAASSGSYDRAVPAPSSPAAPGKPGGVFEPMNPAAAPAPPASSYGQPAAGFGSQPQGESPWGAGR